MAEFKLTNQQTYKIQSINTIKTPALVVFNEALEHNLNVMKSYLEQVAPNTGYQHLCPHVKTNKSTLITKMMLRSGIDAFKCTPNEVKMLTQSGVKDIFIAYPLLQYYAEEIADVILANPDVNYKVQIGNENHFEILNNVALKKKVKWNYFIDIDVGMHRTGIPADSAFALHQKVKDNEHFEFIGLHGYDGHNHFKDKKQRLSIARKSMGNLIDVFNQFSEKSIHIKKVMTAGSPSFREDFDLLYQKLGKRTHIQVSPGTWIYWDSQYDTILPGEFRFAALILAQIMDVGSNQVTLNLGHKRWAADQGELQVFSESDLELHSYSEEHTVLKISDNKEHQIGDYILLVPRHICPTVNLYDHFTLIATNGKIEKQAVPVEARNK